jgi:hypothetical protein
LKLDNTQPARLMFTVGALNTPCTVTPPAGAKVYDANNKEIAPNKNGTVTLPTGGQYRMEIPAGSKGDVGFTSGRFSPQQGSGIDDMYVAGITLKQPV